MLVIPTKSADIPFLPGGMSIQCLLGKRTCRLQRDSSICTLVAYHGNERIIPVHGLGTSSWYKPSVSMHITYLSYAISGQYSIRGIIYKLSQKYNSTCDIYSNLSTMIL